MESNEGSEPVIVLTTKVEPHIKRQLRKIAKSNDRSMAAEARIAVRNHVEANR